MEVRAQTSFIAALVCLGFALSALLRPNKERAHNSFAVLCFCFAGWYASSFALQFFELNAWWRIHLTFGALVPVSAVHFFGVFVREGLSRVFRAAGISALILLCAFCTRYFDNPLVLFLLITHVAVFAMLSLGTLYTGGQRELSPHEHARRRYIALVGGLGSFFTLFDYFPSIGVNIPPVGTVLILLFLYVLAQSIDEDRLLDLYEFSSRLITLVIVSILLALMLWALSKVSRRDYFIHGFVAALVVLLMLDPLRELVEPRISKLFYREKLDFEVTLQQMRDKLAHVFDLNSLSTVVMNGLQNSQRVTDAALYLTEPDQSKLRLRGYCGTSPPPAIEISNVRPLIEYLNSNDFISLTQVARVARAERRRRRTDVMLAADHAAQVLKSLNASAALPIAGQNREILGLMLLADSRFPDPYSSEELALFSKLTHQIALTIENTALYDELKERDRLAALGEMAAGLAHEIRNPLGTIKASVQYLAGSDPKAKQADQEEFHQIIVDEVNRLDRVVRSFLDYARPLSQPPLAIDLNDSVQQLAHKLRNECAHHNVELALHFTEQLPRVRIDSEQLYQVLLNLVQNSIQAFNGHTGSIDIETRMHDRMYGDGTVRSSVAIIVRDNGPGIAKELLPKIFVPFVSAKPGGSGLGLAICQRILRNAGGRIDVQSVEHQGATFTVVLPSIA